MTAKIIPFPVRPRAGLAWPRGALGEEMERTALMLVADRKVSHERARAIVLEVYQEMSLILRGQGA